MSKAISSASRALFGGQYSEGSSNSQQSSSLDPRVFALMTENYERAKNTANQLGARQFAGFSGLQNQGFGALSGINQNAGMMGAQNALGQLQGMRFTPGSFLQGDIAAYQNPYTQQVIDSSMRDIDRARQLQQQQVNAQALSRGAFGGSRQAIAEAENNRNFLDQQARTLSGLRQQGFNTAAELMQSDMARNLQAQQMQAAAQEAALTGGLNLNQSFLGNINAQLQAGGAQQALDQQRVDAVRNLPLEQLQITSGALGLNPFGGAGNVSQGTTASRQYATNDKGLFGWIPGLGG